MMRGVADADCARRFDELALLVGQHLTAGDASHTDPVEESEGNEDEEQAAHRLVDADPGAP